MTKLSASSLDSFFKSGAKTLKAVLFYGQDEGLVDECRTKAVKAVTPTKDPLCLIELTPARIKEDPALLAAEANAFSLMGGRRVICVRGADNYFTAVLKDFLPSYKGDALIVVTAGSLKAKDSLPLLFADSPDLGVFPCYADEADGLKRFVWQTLTEQGFNAPADVIAYISENLGADRLLSRSELAKLAAYMGNEKNISMADAQACIGDASALSFEQLLYAVSGGDQKTLHETFDRLIAEGQNAIGILRITSSHFKRFHQALGKIQDGLPVDAVVASLRLHFKVADRFKSHLRYWTAAKAARVLELLVTAEQDCKRADRPQHLICARVLMQIAAQAKKR